MIQDTNTKMLTKKELLSKMNNKNVIREIIKGATIESFDFTINNFLKELKDKKINYIRTIDGSVELEDGRVYLRPKMCKYTKGIMKITGNNYTFNDIRGEILTKEQFDYDNNSFTLKIDNNYIIKYTIDN